MKLITLVLLSTITVVPYHHKAFTMKMNEKDTIGSVMKCQDKIHAMHDTGLCEIAPHSLKPGKHMRLVSRYPGIGVYVRAE